MEQKSARNVWAFAYSAGRKLYFDSQFASTLAELMLLKHPGSVSPEVARKTALNVHTVLTVRTFCDLGEAW